MKKTFVPRIFIATAILLGGTGMASHGFYGDDDDAKRQAELRVKEIATEAIKANISELMKTQLGSEAAKEVITAIAKDTLKGIQVKDFDGEEKALDVIIKEMQDQHNELVTFVEDFKTKNFHSEKEQLQKFLTDKAEEIKGLYSAGKGFVQFTAKAAGTVTTANGINTEPPAIIGTQQAPLQNVNLRDIPVLPLTNNLNTDLAAYPYTEAIPGEGDADLVAEGAAKPQIDFDWETNYAKPFKVAAWIKLTEEAVQDVRGLQDVAQNYLRKKHDLKKARLILYGTGTSGQPTGATVYGRTFNAGSMAGQVRFTNFMDVVNAAVTDIATTHNYTDEMPYMANLVLVNPIDFFLNLVSAKDERGLPLYPQASLFNRVVIGGITILPEESIPAGKIFVGDMNAYNTTNYLPYTVKIGWVNDDFIKNQFVILGESRFHAFVKKLDQRAFIYDDIEAIKDAISDTTT